MSSITWIKNPKIQRTLWILLGVIFVVSFINSVFLKDNDFLLHYVNGEKFLQGNFYESHSPWKPVLTHYPVGRHIFNAFLALFPYRIARAVCWGLAVLLLGLTLRYWQQMAVDADKQMGNKLGVAGPVALFILIAWFFRDLDDCGLQIILLYMLTAAGWWVMHKRPWLCGLLLAAAFSYKSTPLLFLPFLIYKRRWPEAIWMVVFIAILNVGIPGLILGWEKSLEANKIYVQKTIATLEANQKDPIANSVEAPRHVNRNIRIALARYLQTYPAGHPLFIPHPEDKHKMQDAPAAKIRPHPLFKQFLNLPAATVNRIITAILLAMAFGLAIQFRQRWDSAKPGIKLPQEWAVVMALSALLSPLCWGQHLILIFPCLFLALRAGLENDDMGKWRIAAVGMVVFIMLVLKRELIGRDLALILHSYKLETMAAVVCILLALSIPATGRNS